MINVFQEHQSGLDDEHIALKYEAEIKNILTFMAANGYSQKDVFALLNLIPYLPVQHLI